MGAAIIFIYYFSFSADFTKQTHRLYWQKKTLKIIYTGTPFMVVGSNHFKCTEVRIPVHFLNDEN